MFYSSAEEEQEKLAPRRVTNSRASKPHSPHTSVLRELLTEGIRNPLKE